MASQRLAVASMPQPAGCRHPGVTRNPVAAAMALLLAVAMSGMLPSLAWGACRVMSMSLRPHRLSGLGAKLNSHRKAVAMAAGIQLDSDAVGRLEQAANASAAESLPAFEKPSWTTHSKTGPHGFADKAARELPVSEAIGVVLPVGSACPFRSDSPEAHAADEELPAVLSQLLRIQEGEYGQISDMFQSGVEPDRAKASQVGQEMASYGARLKQLLDGLEHSKDFQALEAYHLMETTTRRFQSLSVRSFERLANWQAESLLAYVVGLPREPGPDIDLPSTSDGTINLARNFNSASPQRVLPFSAADFAGAAPDSAAEKVGSDFASLVRDHEQLIRFGRNFGDFDEAGKDIFLGQMSQVAERWERLIDAAAQAGAAPSKSYRAISEEHISRLGLVAAPLFKGSVEEVYAAMIGQA